MCSRHWQFGIRMYMAHLQAGSQLDRPFREPLPQIRRREKTPSRLLEIMLISEAAGGACRHPGYEIAPACGDAASVLVSPALSSAAFPLQMTYSLSPTHRFFFLPTCLVSITPHNG